MIDRTARTAAPFHRAWVFFEHVDNVFHAFDRRVRWHHKHVVFIEQACDWRGLSERDRWLVLNDGTDHDRTGDDHRVAVAFAGIDKLREADGAACTALVFELRAFGNACFDHGFAQAASGLIKAATGVGTNHEFDVVDSERATSEQHGGAQREQGLA